MVGGSGPLTIAVTSACNHEFCLVMAVQMPRRGSLSGDTSVGTPRKRAGESLSYTLNNVLCFSTAMTWSGLMVAITSARAPVIPGPGLKRAMLKLYYHFTFVPY